MLPNEPDSSGARTAASITTVPSLRMLTQWHPELIVVAGGIAALGGLFHTEVAAAVRTWDRSTTYNHGWLILPIALWLAWSRRSLLVGLRPRPQPAYALLAVPAALAWFAAERMGIMEGRQFAALGLFYVFMLSTLGWQICKVLAAPLAYLVFLVPFGAFSVPFLQSLTARMVDLGLDLTGIPHYVDDLIIEIPAGSFYVAEACAGLRFAIATLAFGAVYALVMFRSPMRRMTVMALALVLPIVANGLRALGLVVLGQIQGSAAAVAADHVLYGWVFFSIVLLLLILAGLPFRQDGPMTSPLPAQTLPGTPGGRPSLAAATILSLLLATGAPLASAVLDRTAGAAPAEQAAALLPPPGCEAAPDGSLSCGKFSVSARLLQFSAHTGWDTVAAERRRAVGSTSDEDVTFDVPIRGGGRWQARIPKRDDAGTRPTVLAAATWLDGHPSSDGIGSRARQALNGLRSTTAGGPVMAVVEIRSSQHADAAYERDLMRAVLATQDALEDRSASLSKIW